MNNKIYEWKYSSSKILIKIFNYLENVPNTQLKATAPLTQSLDEAIGFSFSELVCCSKLIYKTKLI
jgi:hypothetical protein